MSGRAGVTINMVRKLEGKGRGMTFLEVESGEDHKLGAKECVM